VRHAVEASDCLLAIGYRRVDSTSGFFSDALPPNTIHARDYSVDVDGENFQAVTLKDLLSAVTATAGDMRHRQVSVKPARSTTGRPPVHNGPLTQNAYWSAIQGFLRPADVIIAEDGTAAIGAGALELPPECSFITQAVWGSIGYTVGCLLGTLFAAPHRRHLLFVGDGSFQLTAQEVSTMLRHDLKPLIFLVNNSGYTIERTILGKDSRYNDIANWAYSELPRVFRPDTNAMCRRVETIEGFRTALDDAGGHDGLVFIESVMDSHDAPEALIAGGRKSAALDYGPRGPQTRSGSEI
jgi:indolepyruvate decarboxylase